MRRVLFGLLLVALSVQAEDLKIEHVAGRAGFGGEACARMVLRAHGSAMEADDVFALAGVDPALGRGSTPAELAKALEKIGFVKALAEAKSSEDLWKELRADLAASRPSAVRFGNGWRLVVSATDDGVRAFDPDGSADLASIGKKELLESASTSRVRFEYGSKLEEKREGLAPSTCALAARARELKKRVPGDWRLAVERPFVVTGDADVKRFTQSTVSWAVRLLKQEFFAKDPEEVIDIWLFDGKASYEANVQHFFDEAPISPFGYYSPRHRALIMNIATGGGTLVHEIVHPFVRANFPRCPSWFNEGLASLYEQCEEKDGHIHGKTNWRLAGLQKAIKAGSLPTFEKLAGTSSDEFYGQDKGTNYGQARYLCYYLQEKGLLVDFWKKFSTNADDKTGYDSLVAVLDEKDMADFQKRWEKWVLGLSFP
jgi:hypothetical protein